MNAFSSRSPIRNSLGRALIIVGLGLLILWPLRLHIATMVSNNVGSVLLNRALLAPDLAPEERVNQAVQAGRSFQTALEWNPLNGYAYYNLDAVYNLWQDYPSASRALSRAAALNPDDVTARFGLAQTLEAMGPGNETRALREWQAAGAAEYFVNQGQTFIRAGDITGAVEQYERALAIDPTLPEGYYHLSKALSRLGRREEALAALESAATLEPPSSPRRYLIRAEVHIALEDWEAALAALEQAARVVPYDPLPYYRMGWLLVEKVEDREMAVNYFRWSLQLNPDYYPPRLALGRLYAEDGHCDKAAQWLDHFFASDTRSGLTQQAHMLLGRCLLDQGHESAGLAHLEAALALNPTSISTHLVLAQGYTQIGQYHDAVQVYLRVLELKPDNSQAQQALEELGWFEP